MAFCDIRICTAKTVFQAPEVDIGLAADIGGNQMLPKVRRYRFMNNTRAFEANGGMMVWLNR